MDFAKNILEEKYLYKFRCLAKDSSDQTKLDKKKLHYIERIFTHNELYFPSPIDLNDPLECRPLITVGDLSNQKYKEKYVSYARRMMIAGGSTEDPQELTEWLENHTQDDAQHLCDQLTDLMRQDLGRFRICSFCALSNNPLLWTHYADSHQGFCLIFDADIEFFGSAMRVRYQDEYPVMDFTEEDEYEVMKKSAFVKFTDWSYEEEFRLVSREPKFKDALPVNNNIWSFPASMLKGVILGYKMSNFDRNFIEKLCQIYSEDIYLKEAKLHHDNFRIRIVDA